MNVQPNTLRHSTSREAIHRCYQAYGAIRPTTAPTAAAAQRALIDAQHTAIGTHVDAFLTEPCHAKRAELATRLLRRNFECDSPSPRAYEITVERIDTYMASMDPIYPALTHLTHLRTGGDELHERYSAQAVRMVKLQLQLVPDISEAGRGKLIELADQCAKDVYRKLPSASVPAYALRRLLSDEDISLLLRLPNQIAIAEGQQRLDARVANDRAGPGRRLAIAAPVHGPPAPVCLGTSYARFLDAIGIRKTMSAIFSQQALALGTDGASDMLARAVDAQLLRDKSLLLECFQDIDVAAYEAFVQLPGAPRALCALQDVLKDVLSTWGEMAQKKFQQEFAKQVAALYDGQYV